MLLLLVSRSLIFAFAALNLKLTVWRATAFSFVLSLALADIASTQTEKAPLTNASGVVLGFVVLEGLRYLLLTQPLEEFRHESDKVPAYQLPYIQRFFWLMSISPRGIGWSFKASTGYITHRTFQLNQLGLCVTGLSSRSLGSTPLHSWRIHNLKAAYYFCLLLAYGGGEFVHAFQSCLFHWCLYRFTGVCSAMRQYHCNLLRVLRVYLLLLLLVGCGYSGHK